MAQPIIKNNFSICMNEKLQHPFLIPSKLENILKTYPNQFQPAGEDNAWKYLESFANNEGQNYQKYYFKTYQSRTSCSRISPYLSWGNLSVKQAYQFINSHPNKTNYSRAFSAMLTRLNWHCHFIQKFEVDCRYELFVLTKVLNF